MNIPKVVEHSSTMSKDERWLLSSMNNFCSLLPSNIDRAVTISDNIDKLFVPFLGKPHLLDRIIKEHIEFLVNEVKDSVLLKTNQDRTKINAILKVLHSFVRVRGKAAVAYFPNDVFLLTPFIHYLKLYDEENYSLWKAKYVLFFWVSVLLLSPFDISSIEEAGDDLATDLYNLCIVYLSHNDCVGEIAAEVLSLFLSRKDTSSTIIQPAIQFLISHVNDFHLSCLLCLKSFLKHAHDNVIRIVIDEFDSTFIPKCEQMISAPTVYSKTRILLLKIYSQLCIRRLQLLYHDHGIYVTTKQTAGESVQDLVEIPEEIAEKLSNCISTLLSQLQENSILLREKASSYICDIGVYLPSDFCDTVISEVLELIETNSAIETIHGCCYTLAAALANHLIPANNLIQIIDIALKYTTYQLEKKSASSTAVVRDSSCYILWSLVRNYPVASYASSIPKCLTSLITLSVADMEINPRRAAAAVIQEIVGRMGAENVPSGISLINILNYNSLSQIQHIYNVVIPNFAGLSEYEETICNYFRWTAEKQVNLTLIENASKALQHVIQLIPERIQSIVMDPLVHQNWKRLPPHSLTSTFLMLSACLRGLHMKNLSIPSTTISTIRSQFQDVQYLPKWKKSLQSNSYRMALLQSLTYYTDDFFDLFTQLFPQRAISASKPNRHFETNNSRQFAFTSEEQCLLVCSQWFYQHEHKEGIQYCDNLARQALDTPSEASIHSFGAIYYKILIPYLDRAITMLQTKQDPVVHEALAVIIARLLFIQPVDEIWTQRMLTWLNACCSYYVRDSCGDVSSWTRTAAMKNLSVLLDKLLLFPQDRVDSSLLVHGLNEYIITPLGVARALDTSLIEYLPLTEGSTLFPASITERPVVIQSQTPFAILPESLVESICHVVLKQMAEQHTVITKNARAILNFLIDLQTYDSSFMQHLKSYNREKHEIIDQLVGYLEYEDLAPIVLSGLIFLIGGNTPDTDEALFVFDCFLTSHNPSPTVHTLLKILKKEYEMASYRFYAALKTTVVCMDGLYLPDIVSDDELGELVHLIEKASVRFKNQPAVQQSLMELLRGITRYLPSKEVIKLFLPFLSSSSPYIREEASQTLYYSILNKNTPDEIDESLLQVIGEVDFVGTQFNDGIKQLKSFL